MNLIDATKAYKAPQPAPKDGQNQIIAGAQHLAENAVPGTPYALSILFDELVSAGLINYDSTGLSMIGFILQRLIQKHDWYEFGKWGYFGEGGKTTMRQVLDGGCSKGATYDIQACSQLIEILTGDEVAPGQIRKTLQRLVKAGSFIRVDRGRYQRIAKGFSDAK